MRHLPWIVMGVGLMVGWYLLTIILLVLWLPVVVSKRRGSDAVAGGG